MTKPVPEGQKSVTPHLIVSDATAAIEFYKSAFGAEERARVPSPDGRILHAELQIGDSRIYLADEFTPKGVTHEGVVIHLWVPDADDVWENALEAGATVKLPLDDAFWGDRYGQLQDPFGHTWSISSHIEDVPLDEIARRAAQVLGALSEAGQEQGT